LYENISCENNDYTRALQTFEAMYGTASQLGNPIFIVHALQKMGEEIEEAGYGNEKDVKEFRGDLLVAMQHQA
jgi:hypothetical protein